MRRVAIVGIGHTKFGVRNASLRELAFEAAREALEDAKLTIDDLDSLIVGIVSAEFAKMVSPGAQIAEYLGINPKGSMRVEAACATGSAAIRAGYMTIASGLSDLVLVVGCEKMRELSTQEGLEIMSKAADTKWEYSFCCTFAGYYAMLANAHMKRYGTTEEQLAMVGVKNHSNALNNPYAHLHKKINIDDVLNSKMVAYPLKLYDSCPLSDGAAAVVLASDELANKFEEPIWISGLGVATDTASMMTRESYTEIRGATLAAREAYKYAKVDPSDIDLAEVHDAFTIGEILAYEDLGFCKKGKGGELVEEGETEIGGKIPVNTDGGLKAKGHPLGATGVSQAVEIVTQLRGEAGKRQVEGAEIGLSHNVGGNGQYIFVTIYKR
ncbi:MAG: thiolase domain-containing protein [Thermoproteota archaeon]|nr:MAG: thiolase domain-containing protein [Candidatus Korarchaeota archaeon]